MDMFTVYCPEYDRFDGPATLQEVAEMLATVATAELCTAEHTIELVEDYELVEP
jgi:hypothetical protein